MFGIDDMTQDAQARILQEKLLKGFADKVGLIALSVTPMSMTKCWQGKVNSHYSLSQK